MRNPRVLRNIQATRLRACACIFHKTLGLMIISMYEGGSITRTITACSLAGAGPGFFGRGSNPEATQGAKRPDISCAAPKFYTGSHAPC